jgi:hypothetical protein
MGDLPIFHSQKRMGNSASGHPAPLHPFSLSGHKDTADCKVKVHEPTLTYNILMYSDQQFFTTWNMIHLPKLQDLQDQNPMLYPLVIYLTVRHGKIHHVSWVNYGKPPFLMGKLWETIYFYGPSKSHDINSWVLQLGRRCAAHFDGPWRPKQGHRGGKLGRWMGWPEVLLKSVLRSEDMDICFLFLCFLKMVSLWCCVLCCIVLYEEV